MATGVAAAASRTQGALAFPDKEAVAVRCHPAGAGEMGVMDAPRAVRFAVGIETKENMDGFAPVRAIRRCVEQAKIERHVLAIICRERRTLWRLIQKVCLGHNLPLESFISIPEGFVNLLRVAPQQNPCRA